jgi:DNA polymerase I-like protein with 3'-5' exonuclease and polymerase domains
MVDSDANATELELAPLLSRYSVSIHDAPDAGDTKLSVFRRMDKMFRLMQACKQLRDILQDTLTATKCSSVFKQLEIPLVKVLSVMEVRGVCVSSEELDREHASIDEVKRAIAQCASIVAKQSINLLSPEQVARLLYEELHLPKPATTTTKAKHASTSEEDLNKIRHLHPIVDLILFYRSMAKISGTYIEGIKPFTVETPVHDIRSIHACWNQTVVSTGRLSCSRPNLQNLPKDPIALDDMAAACCAILATEASGASQHASVIRRLQAIAPISPRSIVVSRPGSVLVSADYSQVNIKVHNILRLCFIYYL